MGLEAEDRGPAWEAGPCGCSQPCPSPRGSGFQRLRLPPRWQKGTAVAGPNTGSSLVSASGMGVGPHRGQEKSPEIDGCPAPKNLEKTAQQHSWPAKGNTDSPSQLAGPAGSDRGTLLWAALPGQCSDPGSWGRAGWPLLHHQQPAMEEGGHSAGCEQASVRGMGKFCQNRLPQLLP